MNKIGFLIFCLLLSLFSRAQCPTVTCPSVLTLTNCQYGETVTATSNYSANISSRWIGPGNIPLASSGTSTSVVTLNHIGTYTVEFRDNVSSCVVQDTIHVSSTIGKPTFSLNASSYSMACTSSSVIISGYGTTTNPSGGFVTYTVFLPGVYMAPTSTLSSLNTYSLSNCGVWSFLALDAVSYCTSSFSFVISCSTLNPIPLTVNGSNTVCAGSSVTYTANGSNQIWSNAATGPTMNVIPAANTVYTVSGTDANGCPSTGTTAISVSNTCSDVWPGDANSDGVVDNLDVFELGLANGNTGPSRNPGGNTFVSQFASNWSGSVSTGKNQCHADCNGDGVVNASDNTAITANFLLGHAFKTQEESAINPQLSIASEAIANAGQWNKAQILLGDSINTISQLYGIAFELNYDKTMIENDSVKLVYTNSFLNASGQNIEFQKNEINAAKLYAAYVRGDGLNATGTGKVAEFYFKLKFGIPENSILNLSASNVRKIDNSGTVTSLTAGTSSLLVDANVVGLDHRSELSSAFRLFPNPSSGHFCYKNNCSNKVTYIISDLSGRKMEEGEFVQSGTFDLSSYEAGTYFLKLENGKESCIKKLIVNK